MRSLRLAVYPSTANAACAPLFVRVAPTPDEPLLYVAVKLAVVPACASFFHSRPAKTPCTYDRETTSDGFTGLATPVTVPDVNVIPVNPASVVDDDPNETLVVPIVTLLFVSDEFGIFAVPIVTAPVAPLTVIPVPATLLVTPAFVSVIVPPRETVPPPDIPVPGDTVTELLTNALFGMVVAVILAPEIAGLFVHVGALVPPDANRYPDVPAAAIANADDVLYTIPPATAVKLAFVPPEPRFKVPASVTAPVVAVFGVSPVEPALNDNTPVFVTVMLPDVVIGPPETPIPDPFVKFTEVTLPPNGDQTDPVYHSN